MGTGVTDEMVPDVGRDCGIQFEVAEEFAAVARRLGADPDIDSTLSRICALAVERVPGCRHSAISLPAGRGRIETRGATGDVPVAVDRIQYETGQGPCLEALGHADVVECLDLARDHRWPSFAPLAVTETGIRAMLSIRLYVEERTLGALNLYSDMPAAFSGSGLAVRWGRIYAAHASLALSGARAQTELYEALESRETISVAIGILMGRQQISRTEAFDVLRRASQRMNRKLREVASDIAGSGPDVTPGEIGRLILAPGEEAG